MKNPTETSLAGVSLAGGDIVKAVVYRNGFKAAKRTVEEGLVPVSRHRLPILPFQPRCLHLQGGNYNANGCSETAATEVKSMWIGTGLEIPVIGLNYGADWEDVTLAGNYSDARDRKFLK